MGPGPRPHWRCHGEERHALADFLEPSRSYFRRTVNRCSQPQRSAHENGFAENNITATACVLYSTLGTGRDRSTPNDLETNLGATVDLDAVLGWLSDRLFDVYVVEDGNSGQHGEV